MIGNTFSYITQLPTRSITSGSTQDALDNQSPFSFYDFLQYLDADLTPLQANDAYQQYLRRWSAVKGQIEEDATALVRDRYIDLLKDISLNYLTYEEKRFIVTADFTDSQDLDILIPFYSKKIREICQFYAKKREKLKHKIIALKDRGNTTSVEQAIFETLTDFLFVSDEDLSQNVPALDINNILKSLKIEIEELYDLYASYLDNSPTQSSSSYNVKTQLRTDFYSANINSIDADIFINFDAAVKQYIFENLIVYLSELGNEFSIEYNTDNVNLNCKQDDDLYSLISTVRDDATNVISLRKKLIQKYIGSDIYYIKTGSTATDVTSGVLVEASNPSGNLLNRHYPTTATVEEEGYLYTIRRIGQFFRPEKNGILYFSVPESKYKIDYSKLEPNKVYVYPDPNIYGNTTGLTNEVVSEYPLIHIHDYQSNIQNASYFAIEGDVRVDPYTQNFYAYFSKNQLTNLSDTNLGGLSANLADVTDSGINIKWSCDIYGNQYGLFKKTNRKHITDNTTTTNVAGVTAYSYYDGGVFMFDNGELLPESVQADSAQWVSPNLFASNYYYNALFDSGISRIIDGIMYRPFLADRVYDGLYFTTPIDTDYELILNFANTTFNNGTQTIDGGLFTDAPMYDGTFTLSYVVSSIQYLEMDGGPVVRNETYDTPSGLMLINEINSKRLTELSDTDNFVETDLHSLYVKDIITGVVQPFSAACVDVVEIYDTTIQTEINTSVKTFNVYKDVLYIITSNYFISSKIGYDGKITNRYSDYITLTGNTVLSEPFFFEYRSYAMMCTTSLLSADSNRCVIRPKLYRLDYEQVKLTLIEFENFNINDFINDLPVKFISLESPVLTYSSRNDLYSLLATLVDPNGLSYIFQMYFTYDDEFAKIRGVKLVCLSENCATKTINWYDSPNQSSNILFGTNVTATTAVNTGALCIY